MKLAIITDTHFGARKGNKLFHDYFEKFYKDIFFPTLDKENIKHVIHMGDAFDSRKGIDFTSLDWSKRVVFNPLKEREIVMDLMVGNHDAYYKNTNSINSIDLLLNQYDNVITYSKATEVEVGSLKILYIPWINSENENQTFKLIEDTKCKVLMGHLELNGFMAIRGHYMEHGMNTEVLDKFEIVYSGHYHTRSSRGNISYLGNPYEIYWNDVNDVRGFHIFDTDTFELKEINNPYRMFYNIYYNDNNSDNFDFEQYSNKIVKVIVRNNTDKILFEKFIDKLYQSNVSDLKIVDNFQIIESEEFDIEESEDTITLLNRYIDESDTELDKSIIQKQISEIYQEACQLV